jgi:endogenous inhibitor of DNA gyrase (YacG/DUF329 family)
MGHRQGPQSLSHFRLLFMLGARSKITQMKTLICKLFGHKRSSTGSWPWRQLLQPSHCTRCGTPVFRGTRTVKYSFCETATAGPNTPWHIRRLTEVGRMLGGGADTSALCDRNVAWDLGVEIDNHHLPHYCQKCKEIYLSEKTV